MYFHGSGARIAGGFLEPRASAVIGGEKAVFAASRRFVALAFLAEWTDLDLMFGHSGGHWHLVERYPGALEKVYGGQSGFIYKVSKAGFRSDPRLGMRDVEFVNPGRVAILEQERVEDILAALRRTPIVLMTFDEHMGAISAAVRQKLRRRPGRAAQK